MSQAPTPYVPAADFSTLAATPITTAGLPGSEMDTEFSSLATTTTELIDRLAEIQRDDGAVRNGVVGFLAMSADVLAAFATIGSNYRGQWSVGQDYVSGDLVISGIDNYPYLCGDPHTSSADFDSDFSAGVWAILGYRPTTDELVINNFSGDTVETEFNLTKNPVSETNTQVYVDGVYQKKSTYTIVGTSPAVLTFAAAPATGTNNIEVVIGVSAELINDVVTIPNNSVGTAAIINLNVTTGKIADSAVTTVKLANSTGAADGVTTAKIADLAVTTGKLADLSVTTGKIAGAAIDSSKLAASAVQTANIQAGAVENSKLGANSVDAGKIAANAVTTVKILDGAVTAAKLEAGITPPPAGSITAAMLATGAVTAVKIGNASGTFPIQIVQATATVPQTIAGSVSAWTDVTGLAATLTRANTDAAGKVRVQASISCSQTNGNHGVAFRIMRGATVIGVGTAVGTNRLPATSVGSYGGPYSIHPVTIDFIDAHSLTDATIAYKIQAKTYSATTGYINRSNTDTDIADYVFRPISTMTLTELA